MAQTVSEVSWRSSAVALTVAVAVALSGAQFASTSISVFLARICADYHWTRAGVSGAITMLYIGMAIGAPLFGLAADRLGARRIILPLTLLSGMLIAFFAATGASLAMFYVAHLCLGLAQPGMVAFSKLISTWFSRQRALALSAIAVGVLGSQIAVPPLARLLLDRTGWHHAYLIFGAAEIGLSFPLLVLFFHERGGADARVETVDSGAAAGDRITVVEALGTRIYWQLIAGQACIAFCFLSISIHAVGILSEHGIDPGIAVWGLSTFAVGGLIAKLLTGYLLDRFDTPRVLAPFALLSFLSLLLLEFGRGELLGLVALFAFGFGCTACGPEAYLTTRYFGLRSFSAIFGSTVPIMIVFGAGSPVISGLLYDRTGSYDVALGVSSVAMLIGLLTFVLLPPYRFAATTAAPQHTDFAGDLQH